ncbi:hypothetical protein HGH92_15275 [Chitinophaga varians]|uniref:Uncharacterized protein n=1 Tax=Chitinophaga varians TaxID=2202339 RepID=A0A847RRS8_9BACT|nr:hypothetical protein [Chitinophaga varians]NLR65676.1 hypothetical protein [Chitinophaga varians]
MENKLYKYILLLEALLVTAIFGIPRLAQNTGNATWEAAALQIASRHQIISLPFGFLYELDGLPNTTSYAYQQGTIMDTFVSPIVWLLTSCLWVGVIYGIIRLLRRKTDTVPFNGSFWKKVFLSNLLISLVAFAFIFILRTSALRTIANSDLDIYTGICLFCWAAIIAAVLLGFSWWMIETLWQRYRVISVALSGVVLTAMLAVIFIVYNLVHYQPYTAPEADTSPQAAEAAELVQAAAADAAGIVNDGENAVADAVTADEPIEWKGPQPSVDSIRAALQFICYDQLELGKKNRMPTDLMLNWGLGIRSLFAQQDRATKEDAVRQFNTTSLWPVVELFDYTGRDGQRLKACFERYGGYLQDVLPTPVYRRSQVARYRDNLVATHDFLETIPGYRQSLKTLYDKMNVPLDGTEPQAEAYIKDIAFAAGLADYDSAIAKGDKEGNRLAVWLVSFWARRYAEGNADEVYYILRRMGDIYGGAG